MIQKLLSSVAPHFARIIVGIVRFEANLTNSVHNRLLVELRVAALECRHCHVSQLLPAQNI